MAPKNRHRHLPAMVEAASTSYVVSFLYLTSFFGSSLSAETTSLNQVIEDGQTLVSSAGAFELGFFSPDPSSNRRYLGIWFKSIPIQTVVWVANRESPLTDTTGVLSLTTGGDLILSDHIGTHWSTNSSSQRNPNCSATGLRQPCFNRRKLNHMAELRLSFKCFPAWNEAWMGLYEQHQ